MVLALNRERFGVEVIGRKQVKRWPNADEVIAEIELEHSKASYDLSNLAVSFSGQPTKRKIGRPKRTEKDSATKVISGLTAHHGYENGSVTNDQPATNRSLAKKYDVGPNALTRFLESCGGYKRYKTACMNGTIRRLLAQWNRELPDRHSEVRDDD
jgi:hypothetical protein